MKLTQNFSLSEFECNCGCDMPENVLENVKELALSLQTLRDKIKKPIKVNSSYRCQEHNTKVGGVKTSQHIKGKAADLQVDGVEPSKVADYVEDLMKSELITEGGVGRYNTFTHVDIRGSKARWNFTNKK